MWLSAHRQGSGFFMPWDLSTSRDCRAICACSEDASRWRIHFPHDIPEPTQYTEAVSGEHGAIELVCQLSPLHFELNLEYLYIKAA